MTSFHERKTCRLCDGPLGLVLSLPKTPPANEFVPEPKPQETFPLDVMLCGQCGHAQLKHVIDPERLFSNYVYVSGTSEVFQRHFLLYAATVDERVIKSTDPPFAVDIGSNDGTLLTALNDRGYNVLGVEPAKKIAEDARKRGIPTVSDFFSPATVERILSDCGQADIVSANNVFAHADDLVSILTGVKKLLTPSGLFVFETAYLGDLLQQGLFDTIYHEHLSYWSLAPLLSFFHRNGFEVVSVEHVNTHGGSMRVWAKKAECRQHSIHGSAIAQWVQREREAGTNTMTAWNALQKKIQRTREELGVLLAAIQGRHVVGYGAPAKLTTFMYTLGLSHDSLAYVVDDSPQKQGLYTPGLHIPVKPVSTMYTEPDGWPDYVLLTAWNFAESIIAKHARLTDGGTHFIIPLPTLTVTP